MSFVRDVLPALSKLGCNAGTCHGSPRARTASSCRCAATTRSSITMALTDDLEGRRFNRAAPETQPDAAEAGRRPCRTSAASLTQPGDPYYELIRRGSPRA